MENKSKRKTLMQVMMLCIFLLLAILISVSIGSANVSPWESLKIIIGCSEASEVYHTIIWKVRLPRILLSGLTGAGLALAGTTFQGLFQNPLADPHTLGVSSGAALGATIAIIFGKIPMMFPKMGQIGLFAFAGALLTTLLVYHIARAGGRVSAVHIVLAGTAISSMLSAAISILMIFNQAQVEKVYFWTLGSFSGASWSKAAFLLILVVLCGTGMLWHSRDLDALTVGEEAAASLGVDTIHTTKSLILIASLLVAGCVSVSGIIGFVGLLMPHILRILTGASHRKLLPFSAIGGAVFMILCDTCARIVASPAEIPVGAVTALLGGPYFIFLLYRNKKEVF